MNSEEKSEIRHVSCSVEEWSCHAQGSSDSNKDRSSNVPREAQHQWRKIAKESLLLQAWLGSEASSCKPAGLSLKDHMWNICLVPDPTFKEEHFQTQP